VKILLPLAVVLATLAGCAKEEVSVKVVEEQAANSPEMLVEYMWCKAGPDYSAETFAALAADWNELNDTSMHKAVGAFGLVPKAESPNFDSIWTNVWTSQEARDAGWKDWLANDAADFGAKHDATLVCNPERVFLFAVSSVVNPDVEYDWTGTIPAMYSFCKLNEGKTQADAAAATGMFIDWVAAGRAATGPNGLMVNSLTPLFDPETTEGAAAGIDGYRSVFWANAAEREAGMAAWLAEGNIAREAGEAAMSCDDYDFDLYPIKEIS
tara:strand:- start:149 stop:952 length:804 start_codon:yes stop_codon:yes gene_type:complete